MKHAQRAAWPVVDGGSAGAALVEEASGDFGLIAPFPGGALVATIDGLGHGAEAAEAARAAAWVLEENAGDPVVDLVMRCHIALHRTRGAAMSLASFDTRSSTMTWVGVGNVEAALFRAEESATPARGDLMIRGGVVGYQLPPLRPATLPVSPGDTLVMATDGVASSFAARPLLLGTPQEIAECLLRCHAKGSDDALVVVARYRGEAPWESD